MDTKYTTWAGAHVPNFDAAYGTCGEITQKMAEEFPELTRVRGHYFCFAWGEREHWWLVTPDGETVDPTAKQFPSQGRGKYLPWAEGDEEPTGKCPNCGEYAYSGEYFCSEECGRAYVAFCGNAVGSK